jgi:Flp pilus assembly pilin Flp
MNIEANHRFFRDFFTIVGRIFVLLCYVCRRGMERFGSKAVLSHDGTACPKFRRRCGALSVGRFLRDEGGSATIEFVLWVPVFAFILMATVDATILYLHHTEMWNVARDTTRRMAEGSILTVSGAEAYAASALKAPD